MHFERSANRRRKRRAIACLCQQRLDVVHVLREAGFIHGDCVSKAPANFAILCAPRAQTAHVRSPRRVVR